MRYEKIDYYSFTLPVPSPFSGAGEETCNTVARTYLSCLPTLSTAYEIPAVWNLEQAHGFYTFRLRHETSGTALSFGSINAHILVELSGKSCDHLDSVDLLLPLIAATNERTTRIDFAVDFETDVEPDLFSAFRNTKRWKYAPYYPSATGTTVYIGSRTGERMARVYRYNAPHPRAHLLRVEAEYKGKAAKAASKYVTHTSLSEAVNAAHAVFGWSHPLWVDTAGEGIKIPYRVSRVDDASTIRWLYGVVASSLKHAIEAGLIDWEDFVRQIFPDDTES